MHSKNINIYTSVHSCSGSDKYKIDDEVSETEVTYRSVGNDRPPRCMFIINSLYLELLFLSACVHN